MEGATQSSHQRRRRPLLLAQQLAIGWLVALLLLGGQFSQTGARVLPAMDGGEDGISPVFFATMLRDADGRSALVPLSGASQTMFRLFVPPAEQQKKRRDLSALRQPLLAKKYDRNCFFSPVQCTLQQWGDGNPAEEVLLGGGAGKRRRR